MKIKKARSGMGAKSKKFGWVSRKLTSARAVDMISRFLCIVQCNEIL